MRINIKALSEKFEDTGIKIVILLILSALLCVPLLNCYKSFAYKWGKNGLEKKHVLDTVGGASRIKEVQETLKNSGFYSGRLDGVIGVKTSSAVKEFQKNKGLRITGRIDPKTIAALNKEKETQKSSLKKWERSGMARNPNAAVLPAGEQIITKEESAKKAAELQDDVLSYRLKSKNRIKKIQRMLKNAGFYKGNIDGKNGLQTKNAVKEFQKAKGLEADGVVGTKTWNELNNYSKKKR
ncbi:MAG: peptidoglycan-binding protein [Candidatus Omnitrophica bacterium]|nr:peptidoglycan-binding protein [Candidatus Omnitrophota bacterium]